jgi:DNA polymerase I
MNFKSFREIVVADFEYQVEPGGNPNPVCMVARELRSGRVHRLWRDELRRASCPPHPTNQDTLYVAFYAPAELGCFVELKWQFPENILDLFTEFRRNYNGVFQHSPSLLIALATFGIPSIGATVKDSMRDMVLRGGWSADERRQIVTYCESDVAATADLLRAMQPNIDLPRALIRGRYMGELARHQALGIPVDRRTFERLRSRWETIKHRTVAMLDYGRVYDGLSLRHERWLGYVTGLGIDWPRTGHGRPRLDEATLKAIALDHPEIRPYVKIHHLLGQLDSFGLRLGPDSRLRCMPGAFRTKTGRCAPSAKEFIFCYPKWVRGLIHPQPGQALAYVDFVSEEFAVAGVLSGDSNMLRAYESGDVYMATAVNAGAAPPGATKATHAHVRSAFKAVTLGIGYGQGVRGLATQIGVSGNEAAYLIDQYRRTYAQYEKWVDRQVCEASVTSKLESRLGWRELIMPGGKPKTEIRNWPVQANSGEILRLSVLELANRGIQALATVHDSVLIQADSKDILDAAQETQAAMSAASAVLLDGYQLKTDAQIIRRGERMLDPEDRPIWDAAVG